MALPAEHSMERPPPRRPAAGSKPPGPRWSGRNAYSSFVSLLKFTLPAIALVLVGLMVFWQEIMPNPKFLVPDVSSLSPDMAKNLTMTKPRYDGVDAEGRPYSVTAETALQADGNGEVIDLAQPKADITLENGTWMALSANQGLYNRVDEQLQLNGDVNLFQDRGFELHTPTALVDFKSGVANGDQGIQGQGPSGLLEAEGFEVRDQGQLILFTGKSHLTVLPETLDEGDAGDDTGGGAGTGGRGGSGG